MGTALDGGFRICSMLAQTASIGRTAHKAHDENERHKERKIGEHFYLGAFSANYLLSRKVMFR